MTSRGSKWTSDYSFVLNSIDGNLDSAGTVKKAVDPVVSTPSSMESVGESTATKRKRLSEILDDSSDLIARKRPDGGAVSSLKHKAEMDELRLTNDQLRDQLRTYKYQHELFKEQTIRQLKAIEEQNARLKIENEARVSKYYEEKKKWQARLRDAQQDAAQQTTQPVIPQAKPKAVEAAPSSLGLEQRLADESVRYHTLNSEKLELEHKVFQQNQELSAFHSLLGDRDVSEFMKEHHALRKAYHEMDAMQAKHLKGHDRMTASLRNQSILEDQLASANLANKLLQEQLGSAQRMEKELHEMKEEKSTWMTVLQKIVSEYHKQQNAVSVSSGGTVSELSAVQHSLTNPMSLLSILQEYQQKVALLLSSEAALKNKVNELQGAQHKTGEELQGVQQQANQTSSTVKALEARNALLLQRNRLYESEITSMRNMLQSYDMEFAIGKVEVDKVVELKDQVISALRGDVDRIRQQAQEWSAQLIALQDAPPVAPAAVSSEEMQALTDELAEALSDYRALQEVSGMDYLPHKTRILRLASNPMDATRSRHQHSSLPQDQIKRLQQLVAHSNTTQPPVEHSFATSSSSSDAHPVSVLDTTAMQPDPMKLNARLKEMFKEKISTFREAVYLLTGFKMDMVPVGSDELPRLKLRSMFAEQAEDCLLFQLRGESPELLETDFASRLTPQHLQHLQTYNSVPAFLANLTLELFESQTYMG